jgi:hypothetical protein
MFKVDDCEGSRSKKEKEIELGRYTGVHAVKRVLLEGCQTSDDMTTRP